MMYQSNKVTENKSRRIVKISQVEDLEGSSNQAESKLRTVVNREIDGWEKRCVSVGVPLAVVHLQISVYAGPRF